MIEYYPPEELDLEPVLPPIPLIEPLEAKIDKALEWPRYYVARFDSADLVQLEDLKVGDLLTAAEIEGLPCPMRVVTHKQYREDAMDVPAFDPMRNPNHREPRVLVKLYLERWSS